VSAAGSPIGDPVLHLLAGSNGAGKSTYFTEVLGPATGLEFVNADLIAAALWPDDPEGNSYEAAAIATELRDRNLAAGKSFVYETVFSHPSKLELVTDALGRGYLVELHVIVIPLPLAETRVRLRQAAGGHGVPAAKIAERYARLWLLVAEAVKLATRAHVYDNSNATEPFRPIASFEHGNLRGAASWPRWAPKALTDLTESAPS
jgi:predicted ABC-type ATPase